MPIQSSSVISLGQDFSHKPDDALFVVQPIASKLLKRDCMLMQ